MPNPDTSDDLLKQLQSTDESVRAAAAESLGQSSSHTGEVIVALVDATGDSSESVREWAASALESLEDASYGAGDAQLLASKLTNPPTAYWSATVLGRMFEENSEAATQEFVEALCNLMTNPEMDLGSRERAAWALGKAGKTGSSAHTARVQAALTEVSTSQEGRLARIARDILDGAS